MRDRQILPEMRNDLSSIEELRPLISQWGDKRIVMLGEASHGTHEYYLWRAKISKMLIEDYGFNFIAVEGDWPPCYELNRHIKGYADSQTDTKAVLREFERWPSWMWGNWEILELAQWLQKHNKNSQEGKKVGFYGLDVYSLYESLDEINRYLEEVEPSSLHSAQEAMRCFEPYRGGDGQDYAFSTRIVPQGCSEEVNQMLLDIRKQAPVYPDDREHSFSTEQNAIVIKNAEEYYRQMSAGSEFTWNLRDSHMMQTLDRLLDFHGEGSKAIVWAHNTHIGDARYTDMAGQGLYNIGELAREQFGEGQVALIGFGSYQGQVMAGRAWGAKAEIMELPVAPADSWEAMCHRAGQQFYVACDQLGPGFADDVPHRAVGVVYKPEYERFGNYVPSVLARRYDYFLFFDQTKALHKLEIDQNTSQIPETFPFGL